MCVPWYLVSGLRIEVPSTVTLCSSSSNPASRHPYFCRELLDASGRPCVRWRQLTIKDCPMLQARDLPISHNTNECLLFCAQWCAVTDDRLTPEPLLAQRIKVAFKLARPAELEMDKPKSRSSCIIGSFILGRSASLSLRNALRRCSSTRARDHHGAQWASQGFVRSSALTIRRTYITGCRKAKLDVSGAKSHDLRATRSVSLCME
jgi:hypothetical protein